MEPAFGNLLGVAAVAFLAPLALAFAPRVLVPAVVLELAAGVILGPQALGVLEVDETVEVLSLLGLALLLLLAGLELDLRELGGPLARTAAAGFAVSFAVALMVGLVLRAAGVVQDVAFVAIVLSATSLGVVVPVLKDTGLIHKPVGQLVVAGASIADVATVVLLSLLFGAEGSSPTSQALLFGGLVAGTVAVVVAVRAVGRLGVVARGVRRLSGTTAELRIRGAVLLLVAFVAAAMHAGLEVILGAFVAGVALGALDPDGMVRHPEFRAKLQAIGFGLLIPVFFVASGLRFDVGALVADWAAVAKVPLFLVALLVVRGAPAVLYRRHLDGRQWIAAGLLQATSLPFIVAATAIGLELDLLSPATAAGLTAAGLASVLVLPALAIPLLRSSVPAR